MMMLCDKHGWTAGVRVHPPEGKVIVNFVQYCLSLLVALALSVPGAASAQASECGYGSPPATRMDEPLPTAWSRWRRWFLARRCPSDSRVQASFVGSGGSGFRRVLLIVFALCLCHRRSKRRRAEVLPAL